MCDEDEKALPLYTIHIHVYIYVYLWHVKHASYNARVSVRVGDVGTFVNIYKFEFVHWCKQKAFKYIGDVALYAYGTLFLLARTRNYAVRLRANDLLSYIYAYTHAQRRWHIAREQKSPRQTTWDLTDIFVFFFFLRFNTYATIIFIIIWLFIWMYHLSIW